MAKKQIHWVLIRGLTREAGHWGSFAERLGEAFPGSKVDCKDLPGAGVKFQSPSPLRIAGYVDALRDEFEERKNGRRILVSISMASMVALDWMKRYPADFDDVVLINGSANRLSPLHRRLRPGAYVYLLRAALAREEAERERAILEMVSNREAIIREVHDDWVRVAKLRPVSIVNSAKQLLAAALFSPDRFAPASRLLILNSLADRMVHPSCSIAIQRAFGGDLYSHDSAGHDLPLDEPDWVIERIRGWLPSCN